MSNKQLEKFRAQLRALVGRIGAERIELRDEALHGIGASPGGGSADAPLLSSDYGSAATAEEINLALLGNEELLLAESQAALDRIDSGAFGVCGGCGKRIAPKRLEAAPYARHCLRCARKFEREIAR